MSLYKEYRTCTKNKFLTQGIFLKTLIWKQNQGSSAKYFCTSKFIKNVVSRYFWFCVVKFIYLLLITQKQQNSKIFLIAGVFMTWRH